MPTTLFCNLNNYPVFNFHADQWGEIGWVYDPETNRYVHYDIDRKGQQYNMWPPKTLEEFERDVLPNTSDALKGWFASFDVLHAEDAVWIHTRSDGVVCRYGEMGLDIHGRPRVDVSVVSGKKLPAVIQRWLDGAVCSSSHSVEDS